MANGLPSIANTMSGTTVQTEQEALLEQIAQERQRRFAQLSQRAQQAQAEAGTAEQEFQQAAGAPPPQLDPMAAFIPTLLGNIASVIAQDPGFRQRAQDRLKEQRSALLKARAENLSSLRDVFAQKAQAAKEAGDLEVQETSLAKIDQLNKQLELVIKNQQLDAADERERLKRQADDAREQGRQAFLAQQNELNRQNRLEVARLRQETADLKKELPQGVSVLTPNQFETRRAAIVSRFVGKRKDKKAARANVRNFDLNTRMVGEDLSQWIARLRSIEDPLNPGERLYTDEDINLARHRLFSRREQPTFVPGSGVAPAVSPTAPQPAPQVNPDPIGGIR